MEAEERFLRFHVVVDLLRRDSNERVFEGESWLLGTARLPDVVKTSATDAAGEMGMELVFAVSMVANGSVLVLKPMHRLGKQEAGAHGTVPRS